MCLQDGGGGLEDDRVGGLVLKGLSGCVCNQDRATDGGREGFVHQPFPTLPFTFCCMAAPRLSDMTNRSACLTETVKKSKSGVEACVYVCVRVCVCVCGLVL